MSQIQIYSTQLGGGETLLHNLFTDRNYLETPVTEYPYNLKNRIQVSISLTKPGWRMCFSNMESDAICCCGVFHLHARNAKWSGLRILIRAIPSNKSFTEHFTAPTPFYI